MRIALFALLAIQLSTLASADSTSMPVSDQADRLEHLRDGVNKTLDEFQSGFAKGIEAESTRHYTYAAHYWLAAGRPPKQAEDFIRHAMDGQNMDSNSADYGVIPWRIGHPEMKDANSIQFTMLSLGDLLSHYRSQLSPDFMTYLEPHLKAGIVASRNQAVTVGYTNIFLMRFTNLILLGEAVGDTQAVHDGQKAIDEWLDFTRKNGITEFCSPTYTSTAIDNLLILYRSSKTQAVHDRMKIALDMFWTDASASTFVAGGTLGGAHSRNYDFLGGKGAFDWFLYYEGLRSEPPVASSFSDGYACFTNAVENGYRPSAEILAIARETPRTMEARTGDAAGRDRYSYFTDHFAFGSMSCNYGPQDLPISYAFAADHEMPHVSVLCDTMDAPYGMTKSRDTSGHVKPHHIAMPLSCVQDKGSLLALINPVKDLKKTATDLMSTAVIFPLDADELRVDDEAVQLPAIKKGKEMDNWSLKIRPDSILAMRKGDAACVVRFFDMEGLDGFTPVAELKVDGSEWDAGRLVVYQYRGSKKKFDITQCKVGLLMRGDSVRSSDEFRKLIEQMKETKITDIPSGDHEWRVLATSGDHELEAAIDLQTGLPTDRKVDGKPRDLKVFDVNGRDLLQPIWATLDELRANGATALKS